MSILFVYAHQPAWAPVWRRGRTPRRLKKRLPRNAPATYWKVPYTYPGHPNAPTFALNQDTFALETWSDLVKVPTPT